MTVLGLDGGGGYVLGRKTVLVMPIMSAPRKPARMPVSVTPPFVPGGTGRRVVIRRGEWGERMPSSLLRVSAVTAA